MNAFTGGEFIVMGVPGETLDRDTAAIIKTVKPSGFILFARNIKSPEQLRKLTDDLRASVDHTPIITIDQEGGRVSRLKEFMSEPPSAKQLTKRGRVDLIQQHGTITGKLLRMFGFNLNLAPVLDVELDEKNENSLKERTYGTSPEEVIRNATAFAEAMKKEGILNCGKHFPGYSCASVDPHNTLPTVRRTLDEISALEWVSFRKLLPILDTLMIGHVSYPLIDSSNLPATLSPYIVREIVRGEWGFAGCTITDDMDMGAINKAYGSAEAAARALEAGNDLMLVCHNIPGVPEIAKALLKVSDKAKNEAYERILNMRKRLAEPVEFNTDQFKMLDEQVKELRSTTLEAVGRGVA